MRFLNPAQRERLERELRDRFSDADRRWAEVLASPHYPLIMENMRVGNHGYMGYLLQEIWEGIDR